VWAAGGIAYVADYTSGLQVLNVTNPRQPTLLGSHDTLGNATAVWVAGGIAYLADFGAGLEVLNVTNPRVPNLLGTYDTPGLALGVWADGSCVCLADYNAGLQVINVTNPRNPKLLGSYNTPGNARYVWVAGDNAYVADESQGLRVVEVQRNRCRQFVPPAVAQSITIWTASGAASFVRATLTCTQSLPSGTAIAYALSPDAGTHWETVTPGVEHVFANVGSALRWRAILTTSDSLQTPTLSALTISYLTQLSTPSLVSPEDGTNTNDNTPTFVWTSVAGANSYLLQLDTVATFDSPNLCNVTIPGATTSYTPVSPLTDGTWYWRVAANDSEGGLGIFATPRSLHIDATAPAFTDAVTDRSAELGIGFRYDVNASDASGIDHYWVNDTTHFTIDSNGIIRNATALPLGAYWVEVRAFDPYTNYCTATFKVTVQDAMPPVWNQTPANQVIEFGSKLSYYVNASDISGIDHYSVNDTTHFAVNGAGLITNATTLPVGVYWVQLRAYDPYAHYCSATIKVTVHDTVSPTWLITAIDQVLAYGQALDYQISAWDRSGIDHWSVNDTVHFAISSSGRLTSITSLAAGRYGLTVTVYDPYNNARSITFAVTVQAETTTTTTTTTSPPAIPGFPIAAIAVGLGMSLGSLVTVRRRRRKP
jgi:hypothetical protein